MKTHPLGIEHLSVFGLPPVECVTLVADLGCHPSGGSSGWTCPCAPRRRQGLAPLDRLEPCVAAARTLLERARKN